MTANNLNSAHTLNSAHMLNSAHTLNSAHKLNSANDINNRNKLNSANTSISAITITTMMIQLPPPECVRFPVGDAVEHGRNMTGSFLPCLTFLISLTVRPV